MDEKLKMHQNDWGRERRLQTGMTTSYSQQYL